MAEKTIIAASLDDSELKQSIDGLVSYYKKALGDMGSATDDAIKSLKSKLAELGTTKIDSNGSSDGGSSKKAASQEKLAKQLKDTSDEVVKQNQKLQDLQQSLSGASDREQNFISQKERAANTIAQENELLSKQQSELAALKTQQQSVSDAHQKDIQSRQQQSDAIAKQKAEVDRLAQSLEAAKTASKKAFDDYMWARTPRRMGSFDEFFGVIPNSSTISKTIEDYEKLLERMRVVRRILTGDLGEGGAFLKDIASGKDTDYEISKEMAQNILDGTKVYGDACKKARNTIEKGHELLKKAYDAKLQPEQVKGIVAQIHKAEDILSKLTDPKSFERGTTFAGEGKGILSAFTGGEDVVKQLGNIESSMKRIYTTAEKNKFDVFDTKYADAITEAKKKDESATLALKQAEKELEEGKQKLSQLEQQQAQATQQSTQASQQKAQVDAQVAAKEKEIADTKGRIAAATKEQTDAEKNASQAAKEKANIQSQIASQEKQVANAKKENESATKALTDAETKSNQTAATSKDKTAQIKEQKKAVDEEKMSYDNLLASLQYAQREVRKWEGHKVFSPDDLNKYQAALAHVVELSEKLRQAKGNEIYKQFDDLSKRSTFDAKADAKSLFAVDERLKQLNRYYSTLEKESDKAIAQTEKERAAIEKLAAIKDKKSAQAQFAEAQKLLPTENYDQTIAKIERMKELLAVIREKGFFTPKQLISAEASIEKFVNLAQQQKITEQGITDEIKKQAAEIRKSKEFRESGFYRYQDARTPNTDYVVSANRALSIEGQLLENQRLVSRELQIQAENEAKIQEVTAATSANKKQQLDTDAQRYAFTNKELDVLHNRYMIEGRATAQPLVAKPAAKPSDYTELEHAVAQLLNVEVEELNLAQNLRGSYNALSSSLSQMTRAYHEMTESERKSAQGTELVDRIQKTSRAVQEISKELSRPTSLSAALKLSEKSLDDITYKIQQLRAYRNGLNLTDPKQVGEISQIDAAIKRLNNTMNKYMVDAKRVSAANTALGRSWNYMKNRLAFYFTVGASTAFMKSLVEVRSQYELLDRSIGILINDARKGTEIFNQLNAMAIKSPFTTMELGAAAKQLVAFNVAGEDVVDTTRRIADMAAAIGVPMERLTYALGQVKTYGYLNSRDARIFLNAGIPIIQMLTDMYNRQRGVDEQMITSSQVREMMTKKLISYADVMKVVNEATNEGGKFFNFQEKAANTLKIQLANLNLAWNTMLNDIGKDSQGFLSSSINAAKNLIRSWREISRVLATLVVGIGAYKTATILAGLATVKVGGVSLMSWLSLARGIRNTGDAVAFFNLTVRSIPFVGWATAIASLLSYFVFFNDTIGDTGRKVQELSKSFNELGKQFADLFSKAMMTNDLNEQIENLRGMIDKAQSELGITIPVNLEDVNEGNIKEKIQEVKRRIDEYLAFTEQFGKTATESNLEKGISAFGTAANNIFNSITNNLSLVKQGMLETGRTAEDVKLLDKQEGETTIAYLERVIGLYEKMGLLGKEKIMPITLEGESDPTNWGLLVSQQSRALDKLKIKNKEVFVSMLHDAQDYFQGIDIARLSFGKFAQELAKRVDVNSIVNKEQRTLKVSAALDKYASENSINNAALEMLRALANKKYNIAIPIGIDPKSGSQAEQELQEWQQRLQEQADKKGIKLSISFTEEQTEESYANEALNKLKEGLNRVEVLKRKLKAGTATKEDLTNATNALKTLREQARLAGADLDSLNKKNGGASKDPLGDALTKEIQYISEIQKLYKDYQKEGMNAQDALAQATENYTKSIAKQNAELAKFGIKGLTTEQLATMDLREVRDYYKSLLADAERLGSAKGIEALEKGIKNLNIEINKIDYKRITDGLNNELGKLKDEYELAVELDANPEMGNLFTDMFGIDTTNFPKTINEVMSRAQQAFDKARFDFNLAAPLDIFKASENDWYKWGESVGYSKEQVNDFKKSFDGAVGIAKKWARDVVKQTQDLQYKLADNNGKIAIEEEKLANLRQQLAKETNEEQRNLLELQIQDQQNAIDKLKESILEMLPTYQRAFGQVAEHSAWMTRRLMQDYKTMLVNAQKAGKNENGKYVITDPISGEKTEVTENKLGKEIKNADKELQKTQSTVKKIKEAFTEGEDKVVDWVHGIELIGDEFSKLGSLVGVVGEIASAFSNPDEYNETAEVISDISTSISGIGDAAKGFAQIYNGDVIGGATNVVKGLWTSISAWFDNSDKKILQQIKDSERAVKDLELAYKELQYEVEKAYGASTTGAKLAAKANKELQLAELRRQLSLEQSRSGKKRDEDRIRELRGQIIDLQQEIANSTDEIVNDLLGISSVGDAMENLMGNFINALREGEDAMEVFNESVDDMIANMVMKMFTTKILAPWFEQQWQTIQDEITKRAGDLPNQVAEAARRRSIVETTDMNNNDAMVEALRALGWNDEDIHRLNWYDENGKYDRGANRNARLRAALEREKERFANTEAELTQQMNERTQVSVDDIKRYAELLRSGEPIMDANMQAIKDLLVELGLVKDSTQNTTSALQAGISSITETTANALEAYMNGVSQQVYLQSDLMTQIRDAVVGFDLDVQLGVQSQMLLQLQQSYQVQQSIQIILEGVLSPSGRAFNVQLLN